MSNVFFTCIRSMKLYEMRFRCIEIEIDRDNQIDENLKKLLWIFKLWTQDQFRLKKKSNQ